MLPKKFQPPGPRTPLSGVPGPGGETARTFGDVQDDDDDDDGDDGDADADADADSHGL